MEIKVNKFDLWAAYNLFKTGIAGADFYAFLNRRKELAMDKLKKFDDPTARATWILVDEIFDYIKLKEREGIQEHNERNKIE